MRKAALIGLLFGAVATSAQKPEMIVISEPASSTIQSFEKDADEALLVHVMAGDTEGYETAVYKAQVVKVFKGDLGVDQVIFFGPFLGVSLGSDYVLFLKKSGAVKSVDKQKAIFGDVSVYRVMR